MTKLTSEKEDVVELARARVVYASTAIYLYLVRGCRADFYFFNLR